MGEAVRAAATCEYRVLFALGFGVAAFVRLYERLASNR